MKFRLPTIHLPLLAKELTEQAARKRTYIIRVVYAVVFCALFMFMFDRILQGGPGGSVFFGPVVLPAPPPQMGGGSGSAMQTMGLGREMFKMLMALQFVGIFIFLPGLMSPAIAAEKERDTLALLFLTAMSPWEILLEKYLSRLIPMFTFLLLMLPLTAVAYAMGGITARDIVTGFTLLTLACLQLGALSLAISAYCGSVTSAFVSAYVGGAIFCLITIGCPLSPLYVYGMQHSSLTGFIMRCLLISFTVYIILARAKLHLVTRAFLPRRSGLLTFFQRLDAFYKRANSLVGNVVLIKEGAALPESDPVLWREINRRSLGKASYLVRILVLTELPVVVAGAVLLVYDGNIYFALHAFDMILWLLAGLLLTAVGVNAACAERAAQTMDVLLTSPIPGRVIIQQKMRAAWRLMYVLWVPLVSAALLAQISLLYKGTWSGPSADMVPMYALSSFLPILIFPPLIAWYSCWVGLKCRSRFRAIVIVLVTLIAWGVYPYLRTIFHLQYVSIAIWVGYAFGLAFGVFGYQLSVFCAHQGINIGLALLFRHLCLSRADRYMGRVEEEKRTANDEVLIPNF